MLALAASRIRSLPNRPLDTRITGSVHRFFQHFGVSRRTLFWFALTHLLSHMEEPWARDDLIEQIFPDRATAVRSADRSSKEKEFPLALFDPRMYIWHLIHTLSQMIQSNRRLLATVSDYRLRGAGVLQAQIEGRWRTVLAYCGNCGKWPIFLGEVSEGHRERPVEGGACRSCPCERSRLVCDDCRTCAGFDCTGKEYAQRPKLNVPLESSLAGERSGTDCCHRIQTDRPSSIPESDSSPRRELLAGATRCLEFGLCWMVGLGVNLSSSSL